jgi:hypothetical protein
MHTIAGTILQVRLDRLTAHRTVQRDLSKTLMHNIANTFDWDAFGVPTVVANDARPGHYGIIDGQHRVGAVKLIDAAKDDQGKFIKVAVRIVHGDADVVYAKMGGLYEGTRTRHPQNPVHLFAMHWKEHRVDHRATVDILNSHGIDVGFGKGCPRVGQTKCPHVFLLLYRELGAARYSQFVEMLVAAFSRPDQDAVEKEALRPDFIHGWVKFFQDYEDSVATVKAGMVNADLSAAEIIQRASKIAEKQGRSGYIFRKEICNQFAKLIGKHAPAST